MLQRTGKLLLKAFITIFLTLLVIEIGVRTVPLYPDSFEIPDPNYGWRMPANYSGNYLNILCLGEYTNRISINGQGLHDVEHAYEPTPDVERILFIGDSMVAGFEVPLEQTFYRRLETLLNTRDDGQRYEVIGAGHRGYGTDLELLFYGQEASRYQPDMVVLVIQPGNDIQDNHPGLRLQGASSFPYFSLENGQLTLHTPDITTVPTNPAAPSINPIHDTLYQISYLYRLLYRRISVTQSVRQTFTDAPNPDAAARTAQAFEEAWLVLRALITRFRDNVESAGGQFAVMVTTSRSLVGDAGEQTYQMVYAMLDDLKIDYLKLQPSFTADVLPTLQYKCDQHWTPTGHEVVAAQLATFLPPLIQTNVGDTE
jgi:hypothetical protein